MLILNCSDTKPALDYPTLNTSIKDTFAAIDRFEWQAIEELRLMHDNSYYKNAGYKSFEDYCEKELIKHGGYRRIRDLLSASKVRDTLPEELKAHITKPSQTRPLLRLVKTPDKLEQAVAIAAKEKPFPTAADFAKAVSQVVPKCTSGITKSNTTNQEKSEIQSIKVSSQMHPRYGESGVIEADPPNNYQQIVTFSDGEKLLVNNTDLSYENDTIASFPVERKYPKEYSEAIAEIEERHKRELERLEAELRIGLLVEARAEAEEQVREQLESLQQHLNEMEGLRQLELENQRLQRRIQELENAKEPHSTQERDNKQLVKKNVQKSPDAIDLRSLAVEPPKENATECLRLMGIALGNLASAMNNTQALQAAAIILGSEPNKSAIAYRAEQLQLIPQAVSDIRAVLSLPGCTWIDYCTVAQEYEAIKGDYLAELTPQETELIAELENASCQPTTISVGSIVAHADPYRTLYVARGEVIQDLGDEVIVAWDHWQNELKKTDRYFRDELRFWQGENQ